MSEHRINNNFTYRYSPAAATPALTNTDALPPTKTGNSCAEQEGQQSLQFPQSEQPCGAPRDPMNAESALCSFQRIQQAGDPTTQLLPPKAESHVSQFRLESNSSNSHFLGINVHQETSPPANAGDAQRHPISIGPVPPLALMNPLLYQFSPPPLHPIPATANQLPEKLHVNTRDYWEQVEGTEQLSHTHSDRAALLVSYDPNQKHYLRQLATSGRYEATTAVPVAHQPFVIGVRPPNLTQAHEAIDHWNWSNLSSAPASTEKTQGEMPLIPGREQNKSGAILANGESLHFDRDATTRAFAFSSQPQQYCVRQSALQVPLGEGTMPQSSPLVQFPQNNIEALELIAKMYYSRTAAATQLRLPQPVHPVFNPFRGQLLGPDLMRAQVGTTRNPLAASLPCPPPYPQPCAYPLRFPFPFGPPEQPVSGAWPPSSISFANGIEDPTRLTEKWMFGARQTAPPPQNVWFGGPQLQRRRAATLASTAGASRGAAFLRLPEKSALCDPFDMWRSPSNFQRLNLCSNTNDPNTYSKGPLNLNLDSSPNNCSINSSATSSAPGPAFDVDQRAALQEQRSQNRSIFDCARETSQAFPFTALTSERIPTPPPLRQPAALFRQNLSSCATESHSPLTLPQTAASCTDVAISMATPSATMAGSVSYKWATARPNSRSFDRDTSKGQWSASVFEGVQQAGICSGKTVSSGACISPESGVGTATAPSASCLPAIDGVLAKVPFATVAPMDAKLVGGRWRLRTRRKYKKHAPRAIQASANAVENTVLAGVEIHSLPSVHLSFAGDSGPHLGTGSGSRTPRKRIKRKEESTRSSIAMAGRVAATGTFSSHSSNERTAVSITADSNTEIPSLSAAAAPLQSSQSLQSHQLATTALFEGAASVDGERRDGQRTNSKGIIGLL